MTPVPGGPSLLGVDVSRARWLRGVQTAALAPGRPTEQPLRVPVKTAARMLHAVVRVVADLPAGSSPQVVWRTADAELLVHTDRSTLSCEPGLVRVGVTVECDQLDGPADLVVPLGVGTERAPAGLVMSGLTRLDGPPVVTGPWSEAVTAFAWEALLELARHVCGAHRDRRGRPLVPGAIGATARELLVHPVARQAAPTRTQR